MKDLFGHEMTKDEVKRAERVRPPALRGYPMPPGSGPPGETCKTCKHYTLRRWAGIYRKCGLMRALWTNGRGTDIKAGSPACAKWVDAKQVDIEEILQDAR
jgi:hypothetical protein